MKKQKKTCKTCQYFDSFKYNNFITHCTKIPDIKSITCFKRVDKNTSICNKYKMKINNKSQRAY